ncbi:MAG: galactokinase [Verrucomicrobia bacterium]|jgi:galactokinase|nr:galactokinase [Verrucomicrobiota bacterium]
MGKSVVAFAPGRVELLGNHTDYNEGLALAAAIDRGVTIRAEKLNTDLIEISSETNAREARVSLKNLQRLEQEPWANYPLGVIRILREAGFEIGGLRLRASSNLPIGSGLSSSAAFEVATAVAALALFGLSIGPMALAQLCQNAENEFVGVRCGLLDQASSVFGKKDEVIFLDFRAIIARTVPLSPSVALLLVDSGVPHQLTGGEYNERRSQCQAAAAALGVKALRDVTSETVSAASLDPLIRARALHITGENERVLAGVAALEHGQMQKFGQLMFESHESSRRNFQNSTRFLDALVEIAAATPGVLGARLTGGGFGGSTIWLVERDKAQEIVSGVSEAYRQKTGATCTTLITKASQGARLVEENRPNDDS